VNPSTKITNIYTIIRVLTIYRNPSFYIFFRFFSVCMFRSKEKNRSVTSSECTIAHARIIVYSDLILAQIDGRIDFDDERYAEFRNSSVLD